MDPDPAARGAVHVDSPVVRLERVHASYEGERAATLHGINLSVDPGDRLAVIGPNGAGKTTLLEVINGLLPSRRGSVFVFGEPIDRCGHRVRPRIATMQQELFFDVRTPFLVKDVVAAARFGRIGLFRWPAAPDRRRTRMALEAVGVSDLARRPIGRLSGGQQRKVLLARALAQEAELLLLDEPTANLDPEAKNEVASIVGDVERELGATTVVVSHEEGALLDGANRWIRIEAGRITHDQKGKAPASPPSAVRSEA